MHVMFEFKRLWLVCKVTRSLSFSLSFPQTQKKTAKSGTSLLDTVCMHIQRLSANRYRKHTLMALHILREAVGGDKHGALSILHTLSLYLPLSLEELEAGKFVSTVCLYLLISYFFLSPQILEYCICYHDVLLTIGKQWLWKYSLQVFRFMGFEFLVDWLFLNVKLFYL